jgi:formylglycine-generating enzyme required for sulfatase activity
MQRLCPLLPAVTGSVASSTRRPSRACILALATSLLAADDGKPTGMDDMVLIAAGTFLMGDILEEGPARESPVHRVSLTDFYLNRYEVTVEAFRRFVEETGYVTSAESPAGRGRPGNEGEGAFCLDPDTGAFEVKPEASWRRPGLEQDDRHPVTCVSWDDAASYCNWLNGKANLPPAYDVATGALLDETGAVTRDITRVRGFRLPTEAEWEYAARGGGKTVRYGNGRNIARSSEINFNPGVGDSAPSGDEQFRKGTVRVGSFRSNDLGLYDMAGNVWEWCSDFVGPYGTEAQVNPYCTSGPQARRAARGGRWGGGADELRVSTRMGWASHERCNNIGFRVARSKG